MLTCREAAILASDSLDGTMSAARRLWYWFHLAMCAACRRYRAQMALTRAVLAGFGTPHPPTPAPRAVRKELERLRKERFGC